MIKVFPSILAADLLWLHQDIRGVLDAGADGLHVDIMDGHFVPNLSFGPEIVRVLRKAFPGVFLDVHLMLSEPENYLDVFAKAGASALTIHWEAENAAGCLRHIRSLGLPAGLSVKPGTSEQSIISLLDETDSVLIMTVEPGFGGQKLMPECLLKITALRQAGYRKPIAVDGGVTIGNAADVVGAGADVLVMGTAVFHAENRTGSLQLLHTLPMNGK